MENTMTLDNLYGTEEVKEETNTLDKLYETEEPKAEVVIEDIKSPTEDLETTPVLSGGWGENGLGVEETKIEEGEKTMEPIETVTVTVEDTQGMKFKADTLDNYLHGLVDYFLPEEAVMETVETSIHEKPLYKVQASTLNIESIIENAFASDRTKASYSLEELGLHNRLIDVKGVERDFKNYLLIRAPKGHLVVAKEMETGTEVNKVLMEDAIACMEKGERIVIPLREQYTFTDKYGIELERERFRASMSEIKTFIRNTKMQAQITSDGHLVIYE